MMRTTSHAFAGLIALAAVTMLTGWAGSALNAAAQVAAPPQTVPPLDADLTPLTSKNLVGHRLWLIVFDKSSMQAEDVRRSSADAVQWSTQKTINVDVVAVAVISSAGLEMLQDFTTNDAKIQQALAAFHDAPVDAGAARLPAGAPDLDALSNDFRLTGLKTICDALKPWPEKKEMLYFTSGMARGDADNSLPYRDAVAACERAHVTIDSIDARGLTVLGRGAAPAGRGAASASSPRGGFDFDTLSPRQERPRPAGPDFSGTWECDKCPVSLLESPAALWLGQTFTIVYEPAGTPTVIAVQAAPPHTLRWTFDLAGARSANAVPAPPGGDWVSSLSWDGDTLALRMAGSVQKNGKAVPVVITHVLSLMTAKGARRGDLQVATTSAPGGLLPNGVCAYKKIG